MKIIIIFSCSFIFYFLFSWIFVTMVITFTFSNTMKNLIVVNIWGFWQYSYELLLQHLHSMQSTTIIGIINEHINFQGTFPHFKLHLLILFIWTCQCYINFAVVALQLQLGNLAQFLMIQTLWPSPETSRM